MYGCRDCDFDACEACRAGLVQQARANATVAAQAALVKAQQALLAAQVQQKRDMGLEAAARAVQRAEDAFHSAQGDSARAFAWEGACDGTAPSRALAIGGSGRQASVSGS